MRYEYKVVCVKVGRIGLLSDSGKQMKQLNELGAQGWKLVAISEGKALMKSVLKYIFIRELG